MYKCTKILGQPMRGETAKLDFHRFLRISLKESEIVLERRYWPLFQNQAAI